MRKYIVALLLCMCGVQAVSAQKKTKEEFVAIDKEIAQMPLSFTQTPKDIGEYIATNFQNENDRIRAVFAWVTSNIEYDLENMFEIDIHEKKEDKITKILDQKKGICEGFTALFDAICLELGFRSYIIGGYTKSNGNVDGLSHSWNAVFLDGSWYLFDPTWGAGSVNNGKFEKKMNNSYFKVKPSDMIKSHMPFDYLWQFVEYPITTQEFYDGNIGLNQTKAYFNYTDSIAKYDSQAEIDQLSSSAYRVARNGIKNIMTADNLRCLKIEIENNKQNTMVDHYNSAIGDFNKGTGFLNDFINYRNQKFSPSKSVLEIQQMLDIVFERLNGAKYKMIEIKNVPNNMVSDVSEFNQKINEAVTVADEQQEWLKSYLKKGKLARKGMFHKVTWFGIPLN